MYDNSKLTDMDGNDMGGRRVKTADTVFGIIEHIHENKGATLTELSEDLDLAKSTVHSHLSTLIDKELVVQKNQQYKLGLKFLKLGIETKNELDVLTAARPALEELADETDEVAWLVVEEYGKAVYVEKVLGNRAVQTHGTTGKRSRLHHIAAGKAILAFLPEVRIHEIIEGYGLPATTDQTITDRETLLNELAEIREREVAFNNGEVMDGLRAVASPIITDGLVRGSIVVAGPAKRLEGSRFKSHLPELVSGAANEIELRLAQI